MPSGTATQVGGIPHSAELTGCACLKDAIGGATEKIRIDVEECNFIKLSGRCVCQAEDV